MEQCGCHISGSLLFLFWFYETTFLILNYGNSLLETHRCSMHICSVAHFPFSLSINLQVTYDKSAKSSNVMMTKHCAWNRKVCVAKRISRKETQLVIGSRVKDGGSLSLGYYFWMKNAFSLIDASKHCCCCLVLGVLPHIHSVFHFIYTLSRKDRLESWLRLGRTCWHTCACMSSMAWRSRTGRRWPWSCDAAQAYLTANWERCEQNLNWAPSHTTCAKLVN